MSDLTFLDGGGEMGARMRDHDWSTSPLGDPAGWPQSLRSVVGLMIGSRHPMFCAWGPSLALLYNDDYIPIFGTKHPMTLGLPFRDVCPEIWDDVSPWIDRALAGQATYHDNLHLVMNRNGYPEDCWYSFSYSPVRDESGAVAGMFCACTETTERHLADRSLRGRETHLRAVFDQLSEGVIIADTEGKLALVNRAAETIHGVASLNVAPDDYSEVYHLFTEDGLPYPPADLPLARAVITGETIDDARWRIRRPDKSEVLAIGSARPIRDDDGIQIGSVLTLRDDTPRFDAEQAVRESEARFRNLANQSPMMVWVTDLDGSCTFLSQSWYEFTGQREEEALGHGWLEAVHPEDREMSGKAFVESNAAQTNFKIEYRLRGADGCYRWAIDAATPLFGPDGDYLGYVGSVVDIDEQKQVEQSLAERVAEEVERRSQAEQALFQAQKIETLGQLTGGVAHDFNNLLTPIVGALDIAKNSLAGEPRALRLVTGAIQAADRARILVQRLLAFSRRQHLQPRAVDIAALVEGVSDLIHRSIGPRIALDIAIDPELPPAKVDPNQLELALINLAVNARDAMPDGGTLTITAHADQLVDHNGLIDGRYICIAVADTGMGMTQAVLQRAIEPFFTTKDIGEGTGLGLSSVQGLALQSGGELHLRSEVGTGTTATLWLPVSDQQPAIVSTETAVQAAVRPTNLTALLVDDEPLVRAGIAAMLDDLGYRVIEASSAAEATALAEGGILFDVLITDHAMPGRTGTDLAQDLRTRRPDLPVLLVTGYARIAEDGSSGIDRLPKPFRQDELAERLDRLLAGTASATDA